MSDNNLGPALAILGGALAIIGVFLAWFNYEIVLPWIGPISLGEQTGWEIFNEQSKNMDYYYFPLIILILGIVACLISVVSFSNGGSGVLNILIGIVLLVLPMLFYYLTFVDGSGKSFGEVMENVKIGAGIWVCTIGGFLVTAGGGATKKS